MLMQNVQLRILRRIGIVHPSPEGMAAGLELDAWHFAQLISSEVAVRYR